MNKKVILSGCSGQDGSYMADYLLENTDYDIFGIVRRTSAPDYKNLKQALNDPRFKLVTGDLSDSQSIDKVVEKIKPDYFINFAAQSFVASSWELPEQTVDTNSTGVLRCLEAIVRHAPNCRFYSAGSSEQFGDVQYSPQDEKHPFRARSPYGASKIAAHQIVKTYRESFNLYAIQGILFNHESPRRGEEFVTRKITKGIARIKHAIEHKLPFDPIELGNLDAKRDWSHAKDFVRGVWMMMNQEKYNHICFPKSIDENFEYPREILSKYIKEYLLSSNETHSIREFIELSFKEAGLEGFWDGQGLNEKFIIPNYFHDFINLRSSVLISINPKYHRPADVEILLGDSSLARKELGWKPKYSFNDLIKEMVHSDIENHKSS